MKNGPQMLESGRIVAAIAPKMGQIGRKWAENVPKMGLKWPKLVAFWP